MPEFSPLRVTYGAPPRGRRVTSAASAVVPTNCSHGQPDRSRLAAAGTIVYVHGIANKPRPSILKCQWDRALFGRSLGERSRLVYWVNRKRYPVPSRGTCQDADISEASLPEQRIGTPNVELSSAVTETAQRDRESDLLIAQLCASDPAEDPQRCLHAIQNSLAGGSAESMAAETGSEVAPLPRFMRDWLTRRISRALLPDVHDYFFDDAFTSEVDALLDARILRAPPPVVVVAHSLGGVIAYQGLCRLARSDPARRIPLFLTIGSPLGMQEVQDQLMRSLGVTSLRSPNNVDRWVNLADRFDPVSVDAQLDNDFGGVGIEDAGVQNLDRPRHPHSATGYLQTAECRNVMRETLGQSFAQEVTPFTLTRDLSDDLEDLYDNSNTAAMSDQPSRTSEVLIELRDSADEDTLEIARQRVTAFLDPWLSSQQPITQLKRYLAVSLTASQIDALADYLSDVTFARVWSDTEKSALMRTSVEVVHAMAAVRTYGATGAGIQWAILDTGIDPGHPHFLQPDRNTGTIASYWDCVGNGEIQKGQPDNQRGIDRNGHGTHVAAIVAGGSKPNDFETNLLPAVAGDCRLHSYKVLGDDGRGRDSYVIKALDHIASVNESASRLLIHGVNLSLGGPFDPSTYGCGHSPICRELRRLWSQGVMVVVAAGNAGSAELQTMRGPVLANMDLSIGDPGNLEEAITVGSVHKTNPHTYGTSFFSSRGPTADGRAKPDLVAPGEKVMSARAGGRQDDVADLYIELSGTSMATPTVSGILAAFLSQRREMIGQPDRVKRILLENCIDLERDRYHQGAGIPNLVRMLLAT